MTRYVCLHARVYCTVVLNNSARTRVQADGKASTVIEEDLEESDIREPLHQIDATSTRRMVVPGAQRRHPWWQVMLTFILMS